jgi:hypothetical protein
MTDVGFQSRSTYSTHTHSEQRTLGGLVAYLLSVPALVAVLAAPAVVFGAVLGVAGLVLGGRVVRQLSRVREASEHSTLNAESSPPA